MIGCLATKLVNSFESVLYLTVYDNKPLSLMPVPIFVDGLAASGFLSMMSDFDYLSILILTPQFLLSAFETLIDGLCSVYSYGTSNPSIRPLTYDSSKGILSLLLYRSRVLFIWVA